MKTYPTYKDSGIEWIGEIPDHWGIKRFKYCFELITEKTKENLPKIGLENIESNTGRIIYTDSDFESDGVQFKTGDILFGKLRPYLAKVYLATFSGSAVGDFFIFRPKANIASSFAAKKILDYSFITITNSSTFGAKMPRVSWEFISNLPIASPPLEEQTAIANFLDHKTAQIDLSIEKRRELIELLKEHRSAIINEAVTKGINSDVPMKDSGIEWIGEVPEHWGLLKIGFCSKVQTGITPPSNNEKYYKNGTINWYAPGDFSGKILLENAKKKITEIAIQEKVGKIYEPYTILLVGIGATLGKVGIINQVASSNQQINAITFDKRFDPFFAVFFLKSIAKAIVGLSNSSTLAILNQSQTKDISITLPPLKEQSQILKYIETETSLIDKEIESTQKEIALLEEYRQSLISEAVTGKIDVRDYPLT